MTYRSSTVPERRLQSMLLDAASALRWKAYHTFDSRRSAPGFPDLVLVRPPRLLFVELKSEKGKLTVEQQRWLDVLSEVPGVECYVWRPDDLQEALECLR